MAPYTLAVGGQIAGGGDFMRIKLVGLAVAWIAVVGVAQQPAMETAKDMFAKLTPAEQQQYQAATKDFQAAHYGQALPVYRTLLAAHAGDSFLSKMAGESAINTDDLKTARTVVEPVVKQDPNDWQACTLMVRIYAQSGDKEHRDAETARMSELYAKGLTPKELTQYIVEKVAAGDKQVLIWNSLVPWGGYKVYNYARVFDSKGQLVLRIQLESADFDQPSWAKQHPKEAAAGGRMFSLDGYWSGPANAQGQHTESHATYGFLDAKPSYDELKARMVAIAAGKSGAMCSTVKTIQQ